MSEERRELDQISFVGEVTSGQLADRTPKGFPGMRRWLARDRTSGK